MPKSKRQQKTQATRAARESFAVVAERLGAALADVVAHPNCPSDVYTAVLELDTNVFNHFPDVEISLRYSFPRRLVGALERRD
jgi:hypothetical protein